jgi:hypothetical protein
VDNALTSDYPLEANLWHIFIKSRAETQHVFRTFWY